MAKVELETSSLSAYEPDAIRAIRTFSTGRAAQHKEHRNGTFLPQMWWVLTSQSWFEVPISVFLIEHSHGLVLFDTGLDPAVKIDPDYISSALGRFLLNRIFRLHITQEDKLGHKLKTLGYAANRINKAVISHLHFDHVGGISDIPQAELLVSTREWAQLSDPHPEHEWILREHVELPQAKWRMIEFTPSQDPLFAQFGGCHDVMADGSMVLLPTPGHTPGSMSMLVRSAIAPPILLIGDLAYTGDAIFQNRVPGTGDAKQLRETYAKVRELKTQLPDLLIVPSHDYEAVLKLEESLGKSKPTPMKHH